MATITKSRRRQQRHAVKRSQVACIELEYPQVGGKQLRLPLVNVSSSGISFAVEQAAELVGLEAGTNLVGTILRFGDCMIDGDLVVMHLTAETDHIVCGALFYPSSDADLVKLKSVIAGIEAAAE